MRIRERTKNITSGRTPRIMKVIKKNRRKNENPLNNKELEFQKNDKDTTKIGERMRIC